MTDTEIEDKLLSQVSLGYKPTLPLDSMYGYDGIPLFTIRRDIEWMSLHPVVQISMQYFESGITGAQFNVKTDNSAAGDFILSQCERFWDRGVHALQRNGYKYGWAAGENEYAITDLLEWIGIAPFNSRDVFMLTQNHVQVGVRVKNCAEKGTVSLWLSDDVPSKAIWYAHNSEHNHYYGTTQYAGAWRPWRRLAWKDGAEMVLDGGIYRLAYPGPLVYYPEEDMQVSPATADTTNDSQGRPRRFARDIARQIGEQAKAGAAIGMPSSMYPREMGGGRKWEFVWPSQVLNVDPILNYIKNLHDQIMFGVGVPPELIMAAETGSGYSGRRIPLESFLDTQQRIGDKLLQTFCKYVLRPLVNWNFGPTKFEVTLKRLIETKSMATMGMEGADKKQEAGANGPKPKIPQMQKDAMFSYHDFVTDRMRAIAGRALRRAS